MKKLIFLLLILAVLAGVGMAKLGERRVYPLRPGIKYLFTGSRDPNYWWDDVNDVLTVIGVLDVNYLDVNDIDLSGDLTLTGLTASRLLWLDADSNVASVTDFTDWIAGTANEIDITDDADGTVTIGLINPLIVGKGGTGAATLSDGFVLLGNATSAIQTLDVTTDGGIIIGDGTTDPVVLDVGSSTAITILGTVATGVWEATDVGIGYGGTGQSTAQLAINALSAVGAATNEHVLTKDTGTGNAIWKVAAGGGGADVKAGVDVGATADYVGAANSDGFLRTGTSLSYADGGNFITLDAIQDIQTSASPSFTGLTITNDGTIRIEDKIIIEGFNNDITIQNVNEGDTFLRISPKGAGIGNRGNLQIFNTDWLADTTNFEAAEFGFAAAGDRVFFNTNAGGTGTIRPMDFSVNEVQALTIKTDRNIYISGDLGIGASASSPSEKLDVDGNILANGNITISSKTSGFILTSDTGLARYGLKYGAAGSVGGSDDLALTNREDDGDLLFQTSPGGGGGNEITRMIIDGATGQTELVSTTPYLTLHNDTHEDSDGGRESRLNFKGEQTGGEETTLARIEVSHDGVGDDQLGKEVHSVNTGAGLVTTMTLDSSLDAFFTKIKLTVIGGYAIKLTNTTGANTIAGQVVMPDPDTNDAVIICDGATTADSGDIPIGVFLDSGVADDAEAWVVVSGIADVAMEDNVAAVRGYWIGASADEDGYADIVDHPKNAPDHMHEIGHCIESVAAGGGGTHILARCILHFN